MSGDFEVDDLGALMAILAGNAGQVEERRGALGPLNALGDRLLAAAHAARANTRAGEIFFLTFFFFFRTTTTTATAGSFFFSSSKNKKLSQARARTSRPTTTQETTCTASSSTRR